MKLIGSVTSPYVRRVRILLASLGQKFEFEQVVVFSDQGQAKLKELTKVRKIPLLIDGDQVHFDSLLISKYLLQKFKNKTVTLDEEREIVLINEANDSAIIRYQLKNHNLDSEQKSAYAGAQLNRIADILSYFNDQKLNHEFTLKNIYLYCMLDWFDFRQIYNYSHLKQLSSWKKAWETNAMIAETKPFVPN